MKRIARERSWPRVLYDCH